MKKPVLDKLKYGHLFMLAAYFNPKTDTYNLQG